MEKRYQVFVSSTYTDLQEERASVMRGLMTLKCIPAGMEFFGAVDEETFPYIQSEIDLSDYFVLLIGGRYGSPTEKGISYTEQEFDYAVEKGIRVLAFVHRDPAAISLGKSETDPELSARLESFRKRVRKGRIVESWTHSAELAGLVVMSLTQTINRHPAVGWVRADHLSKTNFTEGKPSANATDQQSTINTALLVQPLKPPKSFQANRDVYRLPVDVSSRLGQRLRELRRQRSLTQMKMALDFGIDRAYIADVERGRRSISLPMLEMIAIGLKLSISDLLKDI